MTEPGNGKRFDDADEPDFAEEHTRPTYEDEEGGGPQEGDEATPRGPAGEKDDGFGPL